MARVALIFAPPKTSHCTNQCRRKVKVTQSQEDPTPLPLLTSLGILYKLGYTLEEQTAAELDDDSKSPDANAGGPDLCSAKDLPLHKSMPEKGQGDAVTGRSDPLPILTSAGYSLQTRLHS